MQKNNYWQNHVLVKLFFSLTFIAIDQLSKFFIVKNAYQLIVFNYKGVWGIVPSWAGIAALFLLAFYIWRQKQQQLIYWLIMAAGFSNLLDRLLYGAVVDWIHSFPWFPVFNIADIMITLGVFILLINEKFNKNK